jgi:hypothetical protein
MVLDNQVTLNQLGLSLVDELRSYLEGLKPRELMPFPAELTHDPVPNGTNFRCLTPSVPSGSASSAY